MNNTILKTAIGSFKGNSYEGVNEYLGIPYAKAKRFEYSELIHSYEDVFDATKMGNACPQYRQFYPHLDSLERLFYYREFREGIEFNYDEDCLNLNIYTPVKTDKCPVIVFFHGGGFNSGANSEEPFRGMRIAEKGVIIVYANYRVGVLGYFTHEEVQEKYGRCGNYGLDDQLQAIRWVKQHINEFGGDSDNIMVMGQSAGAISVQYLCLNHENEGLFNKAGFMSGGGMFPKFALPRKASETYDYYRQLMELAGCKSFEEFKNADLKVIHDAYEEIKKLRKDNVYNMMPVIDGYLLKDDIDKLIGDPLKIDYMLGYTSNDMYAAMMAYIGNRYARANGAYVYYFDIEQPGDDNGAFHSSDIRYMFDRLESSWRPFKDRDREISKQMVAYLANFAKNADPNGEGLPLWTKTDRKNRKVLWITPEYTRMKAPTYWKPLKNMLTKGEPKANEVQA